MRPISFASGKVEKEDTTLRAVTSPIINVTIRANVPPGMPAVYLLELLIHRPLRMAQRSDSF
jgi:hypothetical protein